MTQPSDLPFAVSFPQHSISEFKRRVRWLVERTGKRIYWDYCDYQVRDGRSWYFFKDDRLAFEFKMQFG